jgi:hypothetical protein
MDERLEILKSGRGEPFFIDVQDDDAEGGERVQLYIG